MTRMTSYVKIVATGVYRTARCSSLGLGPALNSRALNPTVGHSVVGGDQRYSGSRFVRS